MAEMQSQGSSAGVPCVADDGRQHGAPQRCRRRPQHRRLRPAAAFGQRHQRRQRGQHMGQLPALINHDSKESCDMVSVALLAQALPSASSGVDWLYQFTNNLTNLTTQNGGALTQLGLTELSCISLFTLISMVINWNTTSMTLRFHPTRPCRRSGQFPAPAHHLLPARKLLGESVPRRELRHQSLLFLHRAGDGCGLRSELAQQPAPASQDGWRQYRHAVAHGSGSDPLLLRCARCFSASHRRFSLS